MENSYNQYSNFQQPKHSQHLRPLQRLQEGQQEGLQDGQLQGLYQNSNMPIVNEHTQTNDRSPWLDLNPGSGSESGSGSLKRRNSETSAASDYSNSTERARKRLIRTFQHLSLNQPLNQSTNLQQQPYQQQQQHESALDTSDRIQHLNSGGPTSYPDYMDTGDSNTVFIPSIDEFLAQDEKEAEEAAASSHEQFGSPKFSLSGNTMPGNTILHPEYLRSKIPTSLVYGSLPRFHFYERPSSAVMKYVYGGKEQIVWTRFLAAYYKSIEMSEMSQMYQDQNQVQDRYQEQDQDCEMMVDKEYSAGNSPFIDQDGDTSMDLD